MDKKEIREMVESIIRRRNRLIKSMKELREITKGAVDFGISNEEEDLMIYKGVEEVADAFGEEVIVTPFDSEEYPTQKTVMLGKQKIYMIE